MTFILNKYRFFLGLDRCVQCVCKDLKIVCFRFIQNYWHCWKTTIPLKQNLNPYAFPYPIHICIIRIIKKNKK